MTATPDGISFGDFKSTWMMHVSVRSPEDATFGGMTPDQIVKS